MSYTRTIRLDLSVDDALERVKSALGAQGFGVLTEIDLRATLADKLDEDIEPYVILGACNPGLAHRAHAADPSIGALLPCNVVVRADGDGTIVDALDPAIMSQLSTGQALADVADEAARLIDAALRDLGGAVD